MLLSQVRILIIVCSPIAWPISKFLDWILGNEHSALFRRAELKVRLDMSSLISPTASFGVSGVEGCSPRTLSLLHQSCKLQNDYVAADTVYSRVLSAV